ncbi:MAG: DUF563 domain-containing protein [Alphaproteobacteria bacterium]
MLRIVDRKLEGAVATAGAGGPSWLVPPERPDGIGCVAFERAFVVLPQFLPVTPTGETFLDAFRVYGDGKYAHLFGPEAAAALERHVPALRQAPLGSGCFVLGGARNHYHWLVDFLPRLAVLKRRPDLAAHPVLVNGDFDDAQRAALDLARGALDLPDLDLRPVPGAVAGLTRPVFPTRVTLPAAVAFWRGVVAATGRASPAGTRRLFVCRAGAGQRRLLDEEAAVAILAGAGFEAVDPAGLAIGEQMRLFSGAQWIIGTHGAGLANIVFAPPGARLVELRAAAHPLLYAELARAGGQPVAAIPLAEVADSHCEPLHRDVRLGAAGLAALGRLVAALGRAQA